MNICGVPSVLNGMMMEIENGLNNPNIIPYNLKTKTLL